MILILSQDKDEASTDCVIDWLATYCYPFKRFNGIDFYKKVFMKIDNSQFKVELPNIDFENISLVWLRRWVTKENGDSLFIDNPLNSDSVIGQLNKYNRSELKVLLDFFFQSIPDELLFSSIRTEEINKLLVLKKAKELGITIPTTYILTDKNSFYDVSQKQSLITKAISNGAVIDVGKKKFVGYTSEVDTLPKLMKDTFLPSLFQSKIDKKYEIRSFYLSGKFYSMAIFSQNDTQTEIDFRKYNEFVPNRTVPYNLPTNVEKKLAKLAEFFGLNTGSFDLIKTKDNEYVFLEVNPGGQFEMVSKPCNYYLERQIAKELIKTSKKHENRTYTT